METVVEDGSETGSVTKKKEKNRRQVTVSTSPRTSGMNGRATTKSTQ